MDKAAKINEEYWLNRLSNLDNELVKNSFIRFENVEDPICVNMYQIPTESIIRLNKISQQSDLGIYIILLTILKALLFRYTNYKDITVGTFFPNSLKDKYNWFISVQPVIGELQLKELLNQTKESFLSDCKHPFSPFSQIINKLCVRDEIEHFVMPDFALFSEKLIADESIEFSKFNVSIVLKEIGNNTFIEVHSKCSVSNQAQLDLFCKNYIYLIEKFQENANNRLNKIDILNSAERSLILEKFNNTQQEFPNQVTIIDLFEAQVEKTPNKTAILCNGHSLSYFDLNEKANKIGKLLHSKGIGPENVVPIIGERSIELMIGLFGILKAGGAYLPIDVNYPDERKNFLVEESESRIVLTSKSSQKKNYKSSIEVIDLSDSSIYIEGKQNLKKVCEPHNLAYVIYTSGSTGNPKGVMIEHKALINRLNWMQSRYPIDDNDVILQKTSITFDVSVWELFWWSLNGASLSLLPIGGEKNPDIILDTIEKDKITVLHFVPSMLNVFLEALNMEGNTKKYKSVKYTFASGEELKAFQVNSFHKLVSNEYGTRLINLYGPTEATIDVSYFDCDKEKRYESIPIGKPIDNISLFVIDEKFNLAPIGVIGELCIGGVGLARGYHKNKKLSQEKFIDLSSEINRRVYCTGDYSKWLPDGNIQFLGRIDNQVKIRGFRIEIGEIEKCLRNFTGIKDVVIVVREDKKGEKQLFAYYITDNGIDVSPSDLKRYLSNMIPSYMVPDIIIEIDSIPVTLSGKTNVDLLPKHTNIDRERKAPCDKEQKKMVQIWAEVLDLELENISINDSFFVLGGNSIKTITLLHQIRKVFKVNLQINSILDYDTIEKLTKYLAERGQKHFKSLKRIEKKEYYQLSSAQNRLFIFQNAFKDNVGYNMLSAFKICEPLNQDKIEEVFKAIIYRHESLRTTFKIINGTPVQLILDKIEFKVESISSCGNINKDMVNFERPFDLEKDLLLRVGIISSEKGENYILCDIHHVISDGLSNWILMKEFISLYKGENLPELTLQYKDYSNWEKAFMSTYNYKKQRLYWMNQFGNNILYPHIPYDYKQPKIQSYSGASVASSINKDQHIDLKKIAHENNQSLFEVVFAIVNIIYSKKVIDNNVVLGLVVHGRNHPQLEPLMGQFINLLALKSHVNYDNSFMIFLNYIKQNLNQAFKNQQFPFQKLVEEKHIVRNMAMSPFFNTLFIYENDQTDDFMQSDIIKPVDIEVHKTNFDIIITVSEKLEKLDIRIDYSIKLYKQETINQIIININEVVDMVVKDTDIKISNIVIDKHLESITENVFLGEDGFQF